MTVLYTNIKELIQVRSLNCTVVAGKDLNKLPLIKNAFLKTKDDKIVDFGLMEELVDFQCDNTVNLEGQLVLPTWCDSHSHVVYAGSRVGEFVDKINGLTYQEIAERGGGILNSAAQLKNTPEAELYKSARNRIEHLMSMGTGALEIKSGYGLCTASEIKMLKVIQSLSNDLPVAIKSTFLGAHAVPDAMSKSKYLQLIIEEMLPRIHQEKLADYIDIFCENGYFDLKDMDLLLKTGKKYQLKPKVHVNQFHSLGGVNLAVKHHALSVDHLEVLNEEDIKALQNSNTIAVALPGCSFYLGIPYTPCRKLINAGIPIAIASDYNPGSTPSGNMNFIVSLACIKMKMTPEESINAATINGAYAMGLSKTHGSITKGKKANFIITKPMGSYSEIPYNYGTNPVQKVVINGKLIQ